MTTVGRHAGSVVITVASPCQVSSLQPPLHDTVSTTRVTWHDGQHIMIFSFSSCRTPWCWQDAPDTRRVIHLPFEPRHVHRCASSVSGTIGRVSNKPNSIRVSRSPSFPGLTSFSLHVAVQVQPCRRKTSGIHSRLAKRLPHASRALISPFLHWILGYSSLQKVVPTLKQTTGEDQRLAHICDLPCGVHVASSTRLDTKTTLPVMFGMGSVRAFETNPTS